MTSSATANLQIASLRRQFAAGLIDVISVVGPLVMLVGGGVWAYSRFGPGSSGSDDAPTCTNGSCGGKAVSKTNVYALTGAAHAAGVVMRNSRGPGARIMRIRRVDGRTGGPVTIRSAIVSGAAGTGWSWLVRRTFAPQRRRASEQAKAKLAVVEEELNELRRRYADDPETLQRELTSVYKRVGTNPLSAAMPFGPRSLLAQSLVSHLPKLLSPRNQSVPDWLAGIVTVVER
jgi:hypothetical protein